MNRRSTQRLLIFCWGGALELEFEVRNHLHQVVELEELVLPLAKGQAHNEVQAYNKNVKVHDVSSHGLYVCTIRFHHHQSDLKFLRTRLLNDLTSKPVGTTTKVPGIYCVTHQQGEILRMVIMGFLLSFLFSFNSCLNLVSTSQAVISVSA